MTYLREKSRLLQKEIGKVHSEKERRFGNQVEARTEAEVEAVRIAELCVAFYSRMRWLYNMNLKICK